MATSGALTNVRGKIYPTELRLWKEFNTAQDFVLKKAEDHFHDLPNPALFDPMSYLKVLGENLCNRKYASKSDLAHYERLAVEGPTAKIIEQLGNMVNLDVLAFENHANTLGDQGHQALEHDVTENLQNLPTRDDTNTRQALAPKRGRPDQFCFYKKAGEIQLLLVAESKAAHKLSIKDLKTRLRPMNLPERLST